jgi:hypothetical protein
MVQNKCLKNVLWFPLTSDLLCCYKCAVLILCKSGLYCFWTYFFQNYENIIYSSLIFFLYLFIFLGLSPCLCFMHSLLLYFCHNESSTFYPSLPSIIFLFAPSTIPNKLLDHLWSSMYLPFSLFFSYIFSFLISFTSMFWILPSPSTFVSGLIHLSLILYALSFLLCNFVLLLLFP